MKYLTEYRDSAAAEKLAAAIARTVTRPWTIMEVCGGQTHTIVKYGVDHILLPPGVELVHGPGCPVCVTSLEMIDRGRRDRRAARRDLLLIRRHAAGSRLTGRPLATEVAWERRPGRLSSPLDAVNLAAANPDRQVVFFAIGFETTAPANAMAVALAHRRRLANFSVLVSHVLVPPVMKAMLEARDNRVQGFLGPGHVCAVMGCGEYVPIVRDYHVPIVITGFEPLDLLEGILWTLRQLRAFRLAAPRERLCPAVRPAGATRHPGS